MNTISSGAIQIRKHQSACLNIWVQMFLWIVVMCQETRLEPAIDTCWSRHWRIWSSPSPSHVNPFLGGLSLHLNHLIAERVSAPYRQFGTLPIGIFLSNLDSGQLETSLMTSYCHFWNLSTFGDSRAIWVFWPKLGVFRKSKFSWWRSDGASMRLGGVLGSQITRLYDGTIFGGVRCT